MAGAPSKKNSKKALLPPNENKRDFFFRSSYTAAEKVKQIYILMKHSNSMLHKEGSHTKVCRYVQK